MWADFEARNFGFKLRGLRRICGDPRVCLHLEEAGFGAGAEDLRSPCFSSAPVDGYASGWLQTNRGHPQILCTTTQKQGPPRIAVAPA